MSENAYEPSSLERLIASVVDRADHELGAVELAKLPYLIDLEKMRFLGTTVTGQEYVRAPEGPLARGFRDSVQALTGHEVDVYNEPRASRDKHCHVPGKRARFEPDLEPIDRAIALRILEHTRGFTLPQLKKLAYDTEPMQQVLGWEQQAGTRLVGAVLDLSLVGRDERYLRWQESRGSLPARNEEYATFLAKERAEVRELIASLG